MVWCQAAAHRALCRPASLGDSQYGFHRSVEIVLTSDIQIGKSLRRRFRRIGMRSHQYLVLTVLCVVCSVATSAAHNPLLPRPQQITYGAGHLAVRGLAIGFASAPAPEDRFAAEQLAKWLGSSAGAEIPIPEAKGNGPA